MAWAGASEQTPGGLLCPGNQLNINLGSGSHVSPGAPVNFLALGQSLLHGKAIC